MLTNDRKYSVDKERLLTILRANRIKHVQEFEAATAEYRSQCIGALALELSKARDGLEFSTDFRKLERPRAHTHDYDKAIGLLELAQETIIPVTGHDYETLVMDEWDWKEEFKMSTASYLGNNR